MKPARWAASPPPPGTGSGVAAVPDRARLRFPCRRGRCRRSRGAVDVRLDHDIDRTANQQQMFHIVAPDQHQTPAAVDAGIIDHRETRLPSPRAAQGGAAQPPHRHTPAYTEHREHDDEGDQELHRNRQVIEEFHRSAPSPPQCERNRWLHLFGQVAALLQQVSELACRDIANQVLVSGPPVRELDRLAAAARIVPFPIGKRYRGSSIRAMKS